MKADIFRRQPGITLREVPKVLLKAKGLAEHRQWAEAAALATEIWSAAPSDRHTLEGIAGIFLDSGQIDLAESVILRLRDTVGSYAYGSFLQARLELQQGHLEKALQAAQKAAKDSSLADMQCVLVHNLLARIWICCGLPDRAAPEYQLACRYSEGEVWTENYSNYLLNLSYTTESAAEILQASKRYGKFFTKLRQYRHEKHKQHEKLRIGYISPDFRSHVVAVFARAFLEHYDRSVFEVYAYMNAQEDGISQYLSGKVTVWRNIYGQTAAESAAEIYADEIDILVDLAGHTAHNSLPVLAYRPAPVQVSGIGYFATTGLDTVDYFLVDGYTAPSGLYDDAFQEKLLRLPQSHLCYQPFQECVLPHRDKRKKAVVFGCLNNFAKVTNRLLGLWAEILRRVPGATLFLQSGVFSDAYSRKLALGRIQQAGIPLERLMIRGYSENYLMVYQSIDIALDTYPYQGGGTTCDALYMGVPVISWCGQSHHARFGYSLLRNVGLERYCADSAQEYIDKAVALAGNPEQLCELHLTLRRRMQQSPLLDAERYLFAVEKVYGDIWHTWLEQQGHQMPPQEIRDCWSEMTEELQAEHWECYVRRAFQFRSMGKCSFTAYTAAGFAYLQKKDYGRAAGWLEEAIQKDKEHDAEIYLFLSEAQQSRLDYQAAYISACQAWNCLGDGTQPVCRAFRQQTATVRASRALALGKPTEAAEFYHQAAEMSDRPELRCSMYSSYLLSLQHTELEEAVLFQAHQNYERMLPQIRACSHSGMGQYAEERLRIGYISADFRQHVMASFYDVLLRDYDRQRFQVILYSMSPIQDSITKEMKSLTDGWCDLSVLSWQEAADRIYEDQLDILFDLGGHSAGSGLPLLAWRPAPVQISGLGYMFSTGMSAVDYFLTDKQVDPPGTHEAYFSEKLLYLTSQFCYHPKSDLPCSKAAPCVQNGFITFGVFNHYRKITDIMLESWRKILQRVPESRLLCKSQVMVSPSAVDAAYRRFQAAGLPMERIDFEPADTGYMYRYLEVDIALDTYPYPGGGTTCDALYMGVPVITLYGERRGSRFGLDILQQLGLGQLAVDSLEDYVEKAVALAGEPQVLSWLHQQLRQRMLASPLMDRRGYMRQLEQAYYHIIRADRQRRAYGEF